VNQRVSASSPMRLEVFSRPAFPDGRALRLLTSLRRSVSPRITSLAIVDVYLLAGIPDLSLETAAEVFCDTVAQDLLAAGSAAGDAFRDHWHWLVEVTAKPGVTDPVALTARQALGVCLPGGLPRGAVVQTATQYLVAAEPAAVAAAGAADTAGAAGADLDPAVDAATLAAFFHNPLIQSAICITRAQWDQGARTARQYPHDVAASPEAVRTFDLAAMGAAEMAALSRERLLALSGPELEAVQRHFTDPAVIEARRARGLTAAATDVELEMIAQTWSEHCKHKIFNATIRYRERGWPEGRIETIRSLFRTYIKATTTSVARRRRFLRSVFHDNSGVISFDRDTLLCFKVETHNSPSALDPYGGSITGIVGVNRDIMGTGIGARPIFNTDVLCFGFPDTPAAEVPAGLLHPGRVLEGVHRGIVDGGNQSGIPVVAGALVFDESYLGKPLVFCGTGGIMPARVRGKDSCAKRVLPGDLAVMAGGRIGKDGIHGATFSSEALSETSPTSAVQIGDPITQKKMLDMLLEARDLGLYRGLTDNGAGGLSSSLGEMATLSGGVRIDLDRCPLKYQGLAPWEILVSESQERMSLAVPPDRINAFLDLARRRDVEAAAVGEFTRSGQVEVVAHGALVGLLPLAFLHDGLPIMDLRAEWAPPVTAADGPTGPGRGDDISRLLLEVLADANASTTTRCRGGRW
jgi:hypothetical protein